MAIVFLIATLQTAFALVESAPRLQEVLWIRGIVVAAAAASLLFSRAAKAPRSFDSIVTAWIAIWFVGIVVENALLPAAMTGFFAWDVFITFAAFCILPLPFPRQALAALLTGGDSS